MGLLSDFFIADGPSLEGVQEEDRCQFKGITPLEAAGMLAALRGGDADAVELMDEFELLTPQEAEEWTHSVPADLVEALAALEDSELEAVAGRFAEHTVEELGWSGDDFLPVVRALVELARKAKTSGRSMYLWNCL